MLPQRPDDACELVGKVLQLVELRGELLVAGHLRALLRHPGVTAQDEVVELACQVGQALQQLLVDLLWE